MWSQTKASSSLKAKCQETEINNPARPDGGEMQAVLNAYDGAVLNELERALAKAGGDEETRNLIIELVQSAQERARKREMVAA